MRPCTTDQLAASLASPSCTANQLDSCSRYGCTSSTRSPSTTKTPSRLVFMPRGIANVRQLKEMTKNRGNGLLCYITGWWTCLAAFYTIAGHQPHHRVDTLTASRAKQNKTRWDSVDGAKYLLIMRINGTNMAVRNCIDRGRTYIYRE